MTKKKFLEFCDEKILGLIFPLLFLESYLKHSHMHENLFKQAKRQFSIFVFIEQGHMKLKIWT